MKPNANFKLSKSAKRLMAASGNTVMSNQIKRMHIEAELVASVQVRSKDRKSK
jgi:hypothetical protein